MGTTCVFEAERIGWGASGRNGGQVGSGLRVSQRTQETHYGRTRAQALWALAEEAKALVYTLIDQYAIDCDYKPGVASVALAILAGQLLAEALSTSAERFDLLASRPTPRFPGGRWLRWPGQALGLLYYLLRDKF